MIITMVINMDNNLQQLETAYTSILETIEPTKDKCLREGLTDTAKRAAQALTYFTSGYNQDISSIVGKAIFSTDDYDNMIIVKDIELFSLCEHHLVPFFGKCHIGYIPNGKVLGLSKIARIVDMFSRRLQIQERLTGEISKTIMDIINPVGIGIIIEAQHMCMVMRGCQKTSALTVTSSMLGSFRDDSKTRGEFMQLVNKK